MPVHLSRQRLTPEGLVLVPPAFRGFLLGHEMHWYKKNIGDYAKKAGRLTMLQHGCYNLLLDACYDRETFPTLEQALEWTWASTQEEIEAVKFVLSRFFILEKDGTYTQARVLDEILDYHQKADKNKQIAIDRETKRKQNSTNRAQDVNEASQGVHEAPPNQEPITKNHKPRTKNTSVPLDQPEGVSDSTWQSFQQLRKAKRAPITHAALSGLQQEANKAGWTLEDALKECCARGWQGFKADWVSSSQSGKVLNAQEKLEASNRRVLDEFLKGSK